MSLREWMIIVGVLILVGIVVDGLRRVWRARRDSLEISRGMGADDLDASPIDEEYNPELPNGGARALAGETAEQLKARMRQQRMRDNRPLKPTRRVVDTGSELGSDDATASADVEVPLIASRDEGDAGILAESPSGEWGRGDEAFPVEPEVTSVSVELEQGDQELSEASQPEIKGSIPEIPGSAADSTKPSQEDVKAAAPASSSRPLAGSNRPVAQEVIIINVHSRGGEEFSGPALIRVFEACGLEYGDMNIYHRHEEPDTTSPVQFSVANAVEPGTFEADRMAQLSTPGISFFMGLPGPRDPLTAFEFMLETAQVVVRNLGGELKDERRSVMTPQTIEHCRQRIREFERKRRSVRV
ncbi:cell division protein ZipA [Mangrovitalea sediminis]|uniref:cell division protein ZipA n=1 Tax=Mangrovitalea sediminis TaxID=1982043 RepID=UPI000BE54B5F|nr:cell division protein ZipA [Mangrovitalea sediminis]